MSFCSSQKQSSLWPVYLTWKSVLWLTFNWITWFIYELTVHYGQPKQEAARYWNNSTRVDKVEPESNYKINWITVMAYTKLSFAAMLVLHTAYFDKKANDSLSRGRTLIQYGASHMIN